jgi:hypothetical protein
MRGYGVLCWKCAPMVMPILKAFVPKPIAIKTLVKVCENGQPGVRLEVEYWQVY